MHDRPYTRGFTNPHAGWAGKRPQTDAQRMRAHGRIEPMDRPGLLARILGRNA